MKKRGRSCDIAFYNVSSTGGTGAAVYQFTYELTDSTEDVKVQVVDKENDSFVYSLKNLYKIRYNFNIDKFVH